MGYRPELGMLWETVDPAAALTGRFGFDDAAAACAWLHAVLADGWGLPLDRCERLALSASNLLAWVTCGAGRLLVKVTAAATRERLDDIAELVAWLDDRDLPVAAPLRADDGRLRVVREGRSVGVSPIVPGELLDDAEPRQVADAGRTLARLHEAMADYPHPIDAVSPSPGRQLVHNDFRAANLLHDGARLTAVLDFDEVACRSRAADLGKAAVLLGTRYRGWTPTSLEVRDAFVAAYRDEVTLTPAEDAEVRRAVAAVLGHFGWT